MAHTYTKLLYHVIFSTKRRRRFIDARLEHDLHAYMGGIVKNLNGKPLAIGGDADHVHLLVHLPATLTVVKFLNVLKSNSSKWVHEERADPEFGWQEGYGAFSVSESLIPMVCEYIENQKKHHASMDFETEFKLLLERHGLPFDDRFVVE